MRFHQNKNKYWNQKAFTLLEVLLVMAIIALMANIVLIAVNGARVSARQSARIGNLKEVQTALESYANDNGSYPAVGNWTGTCGAWNQVAQNNGVPSLVPNYIASLPLDPLVNAGTNIDCYLYYSNGTDYKYIDYQLTDITAASVAAKYPTFADPARNTGLAQCSPGNMNAAPTLGVWSLGFTCF